MTYIKLSADLDHNILDSLPTSTVDRLRRPQRVLSSRAITAMSLISWTRPAKIGIPTRIIAIGPFRINCGLGEAFARRRLSLFL